MSVRRDEWGCAHPDDLERMVKPLLDLSRRYTFYVHQDFRRFRLRPWWATGTQGIMMFSELVWRARTRERLEAKLIRFARRDMLARGIRGEPEIRFDG